MTRTFAQFVDCVVHWECHLDEGQAGPVGIYSDTPGDAGGPTRWGVTLATYAAWCRRNGMPAPSAADVQAMSFDIAAQIYHDDFYVGPALDRLPAGSLLALEVFDIAVGSGPGEAIWLLQDVLQQQGYPVAVDGVISTDRSRPSQTADAAARAWTERGGAFVAALIDRRRAYYREIVAADPAQAIFAAGWDWRATRLLAEAQATGPGGVPIAATPAPAPDPSDALNDDPALTGA